MPLYVTEMKTDNIILFDNPSLDMMPGILGHIKNFSVG